MKKLLLALITILALVPAALVVTHAQQGPTIEISGINPTELPLINVTAVVLDSLGQPVSGLTEENFQLSGDLAGQAQIVRVSSITDQNLPVSVVLAIDVSTSMSDSPIRSAREAARVFVENIGPNDPVAIVTFSNGARVVQDFTSDKNILLQAIDNLPVGGETQLYEGALLAAQTAAQAPTPRRAVILLSDGAQYSTSGPPSAAREAAVTEAIARGVPMYTIGLGYGTDRTYLQQLAESTNAQVLESPVPEDLPALYEALANRLRTQYEIVIQALDLPSDGTVYDIGLTVNTEEGEAQSDTAEVRTPVPVPVVRIEPVESPIETPTEIVADVVADDPITSVDFLLEGEQVATTAEAPYTFTLDPQTLTPGAHTLTVNATDEDGETGSAALEFEVAALPSTVTFVPEIPTEPLTEPLTITLGITGQTATTEASYTLDDAPPVALPAPAPVLTIDPLNLAPGEHTLTVEVVNEGGTTTTIERTFTVADLSPTFAISGLEQGQTLEDSTEVRVDVRTSQSPVTEITFALNGEPVEDQERAPGALVLEAANLPPGQTTLDVTVTNEGGQSSTESIGFTVAALPPVVTVTGLQPGETLEDDVTLNIEVESQTPVSIVTYHLDGQSIQPAADDQFSLPLEVLALPPGAHVLNIAVSNEGGQTTSTDLAFIVGEGPSLTATALAPTNTPTISPTPTVNLMATATAEIEATVTAEAQATASQELLGTQSAQAANVRATLNAASTATQQARSTTPEHAEETPEPATEEADALSADDATATADALALESAALATQNAQATADMIAQAAAQQATVDAEATAALAATANAQATEIIAFEQATATAVVMTATAERSALMQSTADAQATADALATEMAPATLTAQAAIDAEATTSANETVTAGAEAERNAQATAAEQTAIADAQATEAAATEEPTEAEDSTAVAQAQATATPSAPEATPTPTITPTLIPAEAETTPSGDNLLPILCVIGAVILLLVVVFLLLSRARRRENRPPAR